MAGRKDTTGPDPARRVPKPWGYEIVFAETPRYAGKVLFIRRGEALSLQYHEKKEETIYVRSGVLELLVGRSGGAREEAIETPLRSVRLEAGRSWHLPALTRHRFVALEDTVLFEVSSPELNDVVRLEDRYGREGTSNP